MIRVIFLLISCSYILTSCGSDTPKVKHNSESDSQESNTRETGATGTHSRGFASTPIFFRTDSRMNEEQLTAVDQTFSIWNEAVGFRLLVRGEVESQRPFQLYDSLNDEFNVIYLRYDQEETGKAPYVLGSTVWNNDDTSPEFVNGADIHLNAGLYKLTDALKVEADRDEDKSKDANEADELEEKEEEVVDLISLLLHETGHALGLNHIDENCD